MGQPVNEGADGLTLHVKRFHALTTDELYDILSLRVSVFAVEQQCPYPELDGLDKAALHVWLRDESGIQAYLRIMDRSETRKYVSIGRVLTVPSRCPGGFGSLTRQNARSPCRPSHRRAWI